MKNKLLLFLILFSFIGYSQTNPSRFPNGVQITGGQPMVTDDPYVTTTGTTGVQGKIAPVNLLIPHTPVNYSVPNLTIGAHLGGIDTRLGQISSTTAGITQRVYFTADNTTVNSVVYFASSLSGKGSTATGSPPALVLADNTKGYFTKDVIGVAQPSVTIGYAGTYSGNLTVSATPTPVATQQRFTVEVYRTDNLGTPIASGVPGAPTGDLGVTVLAILDSGIINLSAGSITNVPVSGILTQNITLNTGERLRYHVSAAKIGTGGGNVTFGVYYGTAYNSYYDVPVAIRSNAVLDDSDVPAAVTVTDAINTLNTGKANDVSVVHKSGNEIMTDIKSFVNNSGSTISKLQLINNRTDSEPVLNIQNSNTGTSTILENGGGGTFVAGSQAGSGTFLDFNSITSSTGDWLRVKKEGVIKARITTDGVMIQPPPEFTSAPATSAGSYYIVTGNTGNNKVEKVLSTSFENSANKTNTVAGNTTSTVLFPSNKGMVDYINTNVVGVPYLGAVVPSSTPSGSGAAIWTATEAGTYTNFGGVVVNSGSFATIARLSGGTFTISQTPVSLSGYATTTQLNDVVSYINTMLGVVDVESEIAATAVFRYTDSYIDTGGNIATQSSMWVDIFSVTEGEKIRVKGNASRVSMFWTYISSYDPYTKISNGPVAASGQAYDAVLTIPAGVSYIAVTRSLQVFRISKQPTALNGVVKEIEFFGDSLTAGAGGGGTTIVSTVKGLLGSEWIAYNYGVGGENTTTIMGRQGGSPYYIKDSLTIPANGNNVLIDTPNGLFSSYNDAAVAPLVQGDNSVNPCYVQGKACTLSYSSGTGKYSIKLNSVANRDLVIPAKSQIIPKGAYLKNNRISVFYMGQNGGYTDGTDLKNQFKKMTDFKGNGKFLIVSSHGNGYSNITEPLTTEFGLKHVNMKEYMSRYAIYDAIDLGLLPNDGTYPTAQDLIDMAAQNAPTSLRSDPIHLNSIGYTMEGRFIYNRMVQLDYF